MNQPRIDVIVTRDPDYETITEIYIDGQPSTECHIWDFDPGRGYCYEEYTEEAEMLADLTAVPAALKNRLIAIHKQLKQTYKKWSCDLHSSWED